MSRPDVVVDLSNICRDAKIGQSDTDKGDFDARWTRYLALRKAWTTRFPKRGTFLAVADRSLRGRIDDRRALSAAIESGEVIEAIGDADLTILEKAQFFGAAVLTMDHFRGHRRDESVGTWVQGNSRSFFGWSGTLRRGLRIVPRDMGNCGTETVTVAKKKDQLKAKGLQSEHLKNRYRCNEPTCHSSGAELQEWPQMIRGRAHCPHCGRELEMISDATGGTPTQNAIAEDTATGEVDAGDATWKSRPLEEPVDTASAQAALLDGLGAIAGVARDTSAQPPEFARDADRAAGGEQESAQVQSRERADVILELVHRDRCIDRIPLVRGVPRTLGRSHDGAIFNVTDKIPKGLGQEVSRSHVQLCAEDTYISVDDFSSHGTWLNGRKLEHQSPVQMNPGDVLAICRDILFVRWPPDAAGPTESST